MDKILKPIKSYVLRAGRMSNAQRRSYNELFKTYSIPYQNRVLEEEVFTKEKDTIIEIGFGMGDTTWQIALENPKNEYVGIEVHTPGVGRLLNQIDKHSIKNLRVIEHDAVEVIDNLIPKNSVSGVHIFFPDPWHKKKHNKRRLIQVTFLEKLLTVVKPGGYIYVATDWEDYANWILDAFNQTKGLTNKYKEFATDVNIRHVTKFEKKGLAKNHTIREILFIKD